MKGSCPIKTHPDWVESTRVLGENDTWKLWIDSPTGEILPPIKGSFYLFVEENPKAAAFLLEKYIPAGKRAVFSNKTTVTDMITQARAEMFKDVEYMKWLKTKDFYSKIDEKEQVKIEQEQEEQYKLTPLAELEKVPTGVDFIERINPLDLQNKMRTTEIINKIAYASLTPGLDFVTMNSEEAKTELLGKYVAYAGQPLVLLGNKLIYITDRLNTTTQLADLMMPFITSMRRGNKNRFDEQYQIISNSLIGPTLENRVKLSNPDLTNYDSAEFKELVVLEAIKEDANSRSVQTHSSLDPTFRSAVGAFMEIARKSMREAAPGIKQTQINSATTVGEIGSLMENAGQKFSVGEVTDKDVEKYNKDITQGVNEILEAVKNDPAHKALESIIDNFIKVNSKQLSQTNDPVYFEIKKSLSDESGRFLRDISERLKYLRKENAEIYDTLDASFKAKALVSSLFTLNKTLDKIVEFMKELDGKNLSVEQLAEKVAHYNYLLQGWSNFVDVTRKNMKEMGVAEESSVYSLLARLNSKIEDGAKIAKKLNNNVATEHIAKLLSDFSDKIRKNYDDQIAALKKQSPSASRDKKIKDLEEKKEKYVFTKDKVNKLFLGQLGDANFWSSMFESYTTNPDPVIASFALFIKGHTQDILNTAWTKADDFNKKSRPIMQRLGMTGVNHKKDWEPFMMIDKKPIRGEDGRITFQPVLSFMAPVKDWRYDLAILDENINDAEKADDREALKAAIKAKEAHLNKYFNRRYTKEFYDARNELIDKNPLAAKALEDVNREIEEFRNANTNEMDFFMNNSEIDTLYRKKQRLYSMYNEDGTLKDAEGQAIAKALQAHRVRMKKFYTSVEKPGAFQRSLESFITMAEKDPRLASVPKYDSEGNVSPEFDRVIKDWIKQNTSVKYTDAYYNELESIYKELEELSKQLPPQYRTDELYKKRTDIITGFKDEYGEPDPSKMGASRDARLAELKKIQEEIIALQEKAEEEFFPGNPGLKNQFIEALQRLTAIRFQEPTEYYLEEINQYLTALEAPTLTMATASSFLLSRKNVEKIEQYKKKDERFKEWFDKNHVRIERPDYKTGKPYVSYERLYVWSKPVVKQEEGGEQYYALTPVNYGGKTIYIDRVPNAKFFYTTIKDEYRTIPKGISEEERNNKYVGKVVSNRGEYLPLTREQFIEQGREAELNDPNSDLSKYINNDYYALTKNADKKRLLELTTEYHLNNQVGIDREQKLYLDLPRYPVASTLEKAQRGILTQRWTDRIKSIVNGIKATLSGESREEANLASQQAEDVLEEFTNPDAEQQYEQLTMLQDGVLNPVLDKIPIRGIQNLPIERVSYDVLAAVNLYMLQTEKQKVFNKISPLAQAILQTLEDPELGAATINNIKGKMFSVTDAAKAFTSGNDKSVRAAAFRAFFNREFKGQLYSEKHLDWLNKVTGAITGGASINYFALNLPSAIKNYWGMLWQMNVEAVAGEYFDFGSMAKGKLRSKQAMSEWTTRIWGGNYNTIDTQMIMRFDPAQGKAEEVIGKDPSRTFEKDLASLSWVYSPRKFMEMEGALQLFYSMMYHHKVKDANGKQTTISYADAWEMDKEGRMVLKAGIDPEYGITYNEDGTTTLGKEFKKFQNTVHEKFKDLNGAFAKFEQPQAQMYFAYRLFAFMRRYFTAMFMNRFGTERANFALETVRTGYYVEAVQSLGRIITSLGHHATQLAPSERRALFKTLVDVVQIMAISAIAALLFGYDDDDEDRFKKLKAKSGALGEDDFRLDGWLSNHALSLLLKTQAENQSFIPLPGLGLNNYIDFTSSTSIAFGPTITSGAKLLNDITQHALPGDHEDLYYKRDTGPYSWQKKGEAKIWNHLFSMLGFSGSQVSPVKGIESWESFSKR